MDARSRLRGGEGKTMNSRRRGLLRWSGTAAIALLAAACDRTTPRSSTAAPTTSTNPVLVVPTGAPAAATAPTPGSVGTWESELPRGEVTVSFWHGTDATTNKLY